MASQSRRAARDAETHPRLARWFGDDPSDPGRMSLHNPAVRRLATAIAPGSQPTDLGGVMSLNIGLEPAGLVLRVHQRFVSRGRLLAVGEVRRRLDRAGLVVPVPVSWRGTTVFHCATRWAELEKHVPHQRLAPSIESYHWLFEALGTLHRALSPIALAVPRPVVATHATPDTLRRWLAVTAAAVAANAEAAAIAGLCRELVSRLTRQWVPGRLLPAQLVHGDFRLSNAGRRPDGATVYLDFGFLAHRPRVHDLAYALAFMLLALGGNQASDDTGWESVGELIERYQAAAGQRLTPLERAALASYAAAVPLYHAAIAGFAGDPGAQLWAKLPFVRIAERLLELSERVGSVSEVDP